MSKHIRVFRQKRYISIRTKLIAALSLISIFVTIYTAVTSYWLAADKVRDISARLAEKSTLSSGRSLRDRLNGLQDLSNSLMHSEQMKALAAADSAGIIPGKMVSDIEEVVASQITRAPSQDMPFYSVSIYLKNGFQYSSLKHEKLPFSDYEGVVSYYSSRGMIMQDDSYTSPHWTVCDVESHEKHPVYLRFVYEPFTMSKLGIVIFSLLPEQLSEFYATDLSNSFLMTSSGEIISLSDENSKNEMIPHAKNILPLLKGTTKNTGSVNYLDSEGQERIASYYQIPEIGGYLVAPFDFYGNVMDQEMEKFVQSMTILGSIVMIFSIVFAILVSNGLLRTLSSLLNFTKEVRAGAHNRRFSSKIYDEAAVLGDHVNEMLDQIKIFNEINEQKLIENQTMELQLIQQQINPHLLYNTLDSILWVVQQKNTEDAAILLQSLSEFFKISLSNGEDRIPLRREIELIRNYLSIQKLARQKEIAFECAIPEDLLEYPIMKLTLQPIVENCIAHGFSGFSDSGSISIMASHVNDAIVISVTDDGMGMLEDEVDELNHILVMPHRPKEFDHFALYNINRRIRQSYGKKFGLTIASEFNEFTKVTITLPENTKQKGGESIV